MNKIIISIPDNYSPEPKDCPTCGLAFRTREDVINFRKWGCCSVCEIKYRYPNREKWDKGWRPVIKKQNEDN